MLVWAIYFLFIGIGFFIAGSFMLQRLNKYFEDIYVQKRNSIVLTTVLFAGSLSLLGLRFLMEFIFWFKFGDFMEESFEKNNWV